MSKFKVGDHVIIVGSAETPQLARGWIGQEAVVVHVFFFEPRQEWACRLDRFDDSRGWYQSSLRLRRPPSWDKWLYDTSGVDSEREASKADLAAEETKRRYARLRDEEAMQLRKLSQWGS